MVIMGVCGVMLVGALVLSVRWRHLPFQSPPVLDALSVGEVARRFAWYCSLLLTAGILVGLLVIGAGGRLAMRLLAVTAGDDAQGRITEAREVVGEITVGGTVGFVVFAGLFGGVLSAGVYLVVRRLLPPGWIGGPVFGAGLLIAVGTSSDPLRANNRDFDIVGPGWVSVLVFSALALAFGLVLAAFVARLSAWLPLPAKDPAVLVRYVPVLLVALIGFSVSSSLIAMGVLVVLATRWPPVLRAVRSPVAILIGRVALAAIVLMSLPDAVESMGDIVNR